MSRDHTLASDCGMQSVCALIFGLRGNLVHKVRVPIELYFSEQHFTYSGRTSSGRGGRSGIRSTSLGCIMKRFIVVVGGLILFTGILSGVLSFLAARRESSVVTDTSCDPPCWHRIQPGQTTPWEAVDILLGLPGVASDSIRQWGDDDQASEIAWKFTPPVRDSAGYIYSLDGRVAAISLMTIGSLNLSEAFEKLGEPDYMWLRYRKVEGRHWLEVSLMYPTEGFVVTVDVDLPVEAESLSVEITGNSPVWRVVYFDPARYEDLLDSRTLFKEDRQTILHGLRAWQGLGVISYEYLLSN